MSNTNNNLQTQTSNALHNAIMEAGGKDRPPMLAPGSSETTTEGYMENYKNISQDIRNQLDVEAEAVQIILTRIDNDIYSKVDACPNACEMWKAIERFVTLLKQSQELKTVSYHKLYDILKQHQNEVNEIRVERLARTANPLALVAQQQPVYHPQSNHTHYTQNSSTRSQQAATRNRGKAIVNSPLPIYDQELDMVTEEDALSKEKEIAKLVALISLSFKKIYKPTNNNLRTSSNTNRANQDNTPRINRGTGECQKPKRAKDAAYHKEKMLLYTADNSGPIFDVGPLQKVQNDDDNYNVFANDREHPEQPESINVTYLNEHGDTNITTDSLDMSNNGGEADHDEDEDLAIECDLLASLIDKLKCEVNDSKNRNKLLESSNKTLVDKLKGCYNGNLALMLTPESDEMIRLAQESQLKLNPFIQNTIEGNFCPQIRKINVDLEKFHLCLKEEMVADLRYFNSIENEVDSLKSQLETQKTQFLNEIDRLSREYYYADHMNAILGVYTTLDEFTDLQCDYVGPVVKCERLEKELSKK
ncbi:hypothetical protein Tco_1045487 [Tanacetum coccineum]|uniref:Uncharacterized protein n=1 Tax=Tanacetum coccineum TaxID=301880 RepID=A0ABQ5GUV1_9ASTR